VFSSNFLISGRSVCLKKGNERHITMVGEEETFSKIKLRNCVSHIFTITWQESEKGVSCSYENHF